MGFGQSFKQTFFRSHNQPHANDRSPPSAGPTKTSGKKKVRGQKHKKPGIFQTARNQSSASNHPPTNYPSPTNYPPRERYDEPSPYSRPSSSRGSHSVEEDRHSSYQDSPSSSYYGATRADGSGYGHLQASNRPPSRGPRHAPGDYPPHRTGSRQSSYNEPAPQSRRDSRPNYSNFSPPVGPRGDFYPTYRQEQPQGSHVEMRPPPAPSRLPPSPPKFRGGISFSGYPCPEICEGPCTGAGAHPITSQLAPILQSVSMYLTERRRCVRQNLVQVDPLQLSPDMHSIGLLCPRCSHVRTYQLGDKYYPAGVQSGRREALSDKENDWLAQEMAGIGMECYSCPEKPTPEETKTESLRKGLYSPRHDQYATAIPAPPANSLGEDRSGTREHSKGNWKKEAPSMRTLGEQAQAVILYFKAFSGSDDSIESLVGSKTVIDGSITCLKNLNDGEQDKVYAFGKQCKYTVDQLQKTRQREYSTNPKENKEMVKQNQWIWLMVNHPADAGAESPMNFSSESTRFGSLTTKARPAFVGEQGETSFKAHLAFTFGVKGEYSALESQSPAEQYRFMEVYHVPKGRPGENQGPPDGALIVFDGDQPSSGARPCIEIVSIDVPYGTAMASGRGSVSALSRYQLETKERIAHDYNYEITRAKTEADLARSNITIPAEQRQKDYNLWMEEHRTKMGSEHSALRDNLLPPSPSSLPDGTSALLTSKAMSSPPSIKSAIQDNPDVVESVASPSRQHGSPKASDQQITHEVRGEDAPPPDDDKLFGMFLQPNRNQTGSLLIPPTLQGSAGSDVGNTARGPVTSMGSHFGRLDCEKSSMEGQVQQAEPETSLKRKHWPDQVQDNEHEMVEENQNGEQEQEQEREVKKAKH